MVVVAAYGLFLPPEVLNVPPQGCLNIHPSHLPRYRGPSPVVSAILNGDDETGATIMKLDEGMDSGPILAQERVSIAEEETAPELTRRLFDVGADLLVDTLPRWLSGDIQATPQDESRATFTTLVKKGGRRDRLEYQCRADWENGARHTSLGPERLRIGTASCSRY